MELKKGVSIYFHLALATIMLLSILTIKDTWARYSTSTINSDMAYVAQLDILINPPKAFVNVSGENPFAFRFSQKGQSISFVFSITNNGEVAVQCKPFFKKGKVKHKVQIMDEVDKEVESFVVEIGDTIEFRIVLFAEGIHAEMVNDNLVILVEQL